MFLAVFIMSLPDVAYALLSKENSLNDIFTVFIMIYHRKSAV